MKNMRNYLLSTIIVLFTACSDNVLLEQNISQQVITRGITNGQSLTNPLLIDDWEHQETIVFSNNQKILAPWVAGANIITTDEFAKDIKKEDGWVMLFHTFKELNYGPKTNYLFFYNQLTGFLKVFYYNEFDFFGPNGALWYFTSMNGASTSLFNLNDYIALPDNSSRKNSFISLSNAINDPSNGFQFGWNGFEIEVPYTKDYKNINFSLSTYNKQLSSFSFDGKTESTIEGTIVKTMSKESGITSGISTIAGKGAKSLVDKLYEKSKKADDASGGKPSFGSKILRALADIPKSDYASAISKGLNFIFGFTTSTDTQEVHLTSHGTMNLTGSSLTVTTGASAPIGLLNFYDIMNNKMSKDNSVSSIIPNSSTTDNTEDRYLGVWTLKDTPIIYVSQYSALDKTYSGDYSLYPPYLTRPIEYHIEINPNIKPYIVSYEMTASIIDYSKKSKANTDSDISMEDNPDLIYSDSSIIVKESVLTTQKSIGQVSNPSTQPVPYGYSVFYDWGTEYNNNDLVVITVTIKYDYNGKRKTVTSSRTYTPKYIVNTAVSKQILLSRGKNYYIINDPNNY